jgi:hypothetical protein
MKIATIQAWKMKGPLPDVETNVSGITDPFLLNNRVFFVLSGNFSIIIKLNCLNYPELINKWYCKKCQKDSGTLSKIKRQPKKSSLSHERSMVNEKIPECESDTKRK